MVNKTWTFYVILRYTKKNITLLEHLNSYYSKDKKLIVKKTLYHKDPPIVQYPLATLKCSHA